MVGWNKLIDMTSQFFFSFFLLFWGVLQRIVYISTLIMGQRRLCFGILCHSSHGFEKVNYGYKRLKNIMVKGNI